MIRKLSALLSCAILVIISSNVSANSSRSNDSFYNTYEYSGDWGHHFLRSRIKRYLRQREVSSIATAADRSGRLAGAAVGLSPFQADETYLALLNEQFNYITPENVAKWGELQPNNQNEWDFSATDALLENSEANDQLFKGHALVWHVQLPNFINDDLSAEELKSLTNAHINTVLGRYSGRIYAWDVVNEAISDGSEFYRDTVFLRKLGESYIADAFHTAKAADPFAKLYYNDYSIERINTKSDKVYELVKGLIEDGVPIDGVGFQMHIDASFPPSVEQIIENLERFTALGLTVNVSELDVRVAGLPWDDATNLALQRQVYHRVTDACMQVSDCEGITTWGLTDRYSWIDSAFAPDDPLQYNEDFDRKPAYYGMIDGFVGLDAEPVGTLPNLIANSSFEVGTDGWFAFGDGDLKTIKSRRVFGRRNQTGNRSLLISNRSEAFNGPAYSLLDVLLPNQTYDVTSLVSIRGVRRADVNASVQLQCEGEDAQFINAGTTKTRKYLWKKLSGEFTTPDCALEVANLYFEGPQSRAKIILDNPSVRPREFVIAQNNDLGPNVLTNGGFESGIDSWFGFDSATVSAVNETPFAGDGVGYATDRTAPFDGLATRVLDIIEPGKDYQLTSRVRLEGTESSQVKATLRVDCPAGVQFIGIAGAQANNTQWSLLTGVVGIPNCGATDMVLYFEGPDAEVNLYLDEVYLQKILTEPSANLINNGEFEVNTDGWFGFGAAFLSATSDQANQGEQSLIASNRTQTFEGPAISLTNSLTAGASYNFDGFTRIQGAANADVRATLQLECAGVPGEQYLGVASVVASNTGWSQLSGSVTIPECTISNANLFIEGPDAGIDILVDSLSLESGGGTTPPTSDNLVANSGFEVDSSQWFGFGGTLIQTTDGQAFAGLQSLLSTNRTANFEGPAIDLVGAALPDNSYDISAQVRIDGANAADVSATVQTVCADGTEEFTGTSSVVANNVDWVELSGSITLPSCDATAQRLYFQGPDGGIDILLDEVSVTLAN